MHREDYISLITDLLADVVENRISTTKLISEVRLRYQRYLTDEWRSGSLREVRVFIRFSQRNLPYFRTFYSTKRISYAIHNFRDLTVARILLLSFSEVLFLLLQSIHVEVVFLGLVGMCCVLACIIPGTELWLACRPIRENYKPSRHPSVLAFLLSVFVFILG